MSRLAPDNRIRVPAAVLHETFAVLRRCGSGRRECQVIWTGPWKDPRQVTEVIHPAHHAHASGFEVESSWLTKFWLDLSRTKTGARVQVHTHPGRAFHSATDDAFPLIHTSGFFSLVIPDFAMGRVGFDNAFVTEINEDGQWHPVSPFECMEVIR